MERTTTGEEDQPPGDGDNSPTERILRDYLPETPESDENVSDNTDRSKEAGKDSELTHETKIPSETTPERVNSSETGVSDGVVEGSHAETGYFGQTHGNSEEGETEPWLDFDTEEEPSSLGFPPKRRVTVDWNKTILSQSEFAEYRAGTWDPRPHYQRHTKASEAKLNDQPLMRRELSRTISTNLRRSSSPPAEGSDEIYRKASNVHHGPTFPLAKKRSEEHSQKSVAQPHTPGHPHLRRESTKWQYEQTLPRGLKAYSDERDIVDPNSPKFQAPPLEISQTIPPESNQVSTAEEARYKHSQCKETLESEKKLVQGEQQSFAEAKASIQASDREKIKQAGSWLDKVLGKAESDLGPLQKHKMQLKDIRMAVLENQYNATQEVHRLTTENEELRETIRGLEEQLQNLQTEGDEVRAEHDADRRHMAKLERIEGYEPENEENINTLPHNEQGGREPNTLCADHDCPYAKKLAKLHQYMESVRETIKDVKQREESMKKAMEIFAEILLDSEMPDKLQDLIIQITRMIEWYVGKIEQVEASRKGLGWEAGNEDEYVAESDEIRRLEEKIEDLKRKFTQDLEIQEITIRSQTDVIKELKKRLRQEKASSKTSRSEIASLKTAVTEKERVIETRAKDEEEGSAFAKEVKLLQRARDEILSGLNHNETDTKTWKALYLQKEKQYTKLKASQEGIISRANAIIDTDAYQRMILFERELLKASDSIRALERSRDNYKEQAEQWEDEHTMLRIRHETSTNEQAAAIEALRLEAFEYMKVYHDRIPKEDGTPHFWDIKHLQKLVDEAQGKCIHYEDMIEKVRRERDVAYNIIRDMQEQGWKIPHQKDTKPQVYSYPFDEAYHKEVDKRKRDLEMPMYEADQAVVARIQEQVEQFKEEMQIQRRKVGEEEDLIEQARRWKMGKYYPPSRTGYKDVENDVWKRWDVEGYLLDAGSGKDKEMAVSMRKRMRKAEKVKTREGVDKRNEAFRGRY